MRNTLFFLAISAFLLVSTSTFGQVKMPSTFTFGIDLNHYLAYNDIMITGAIMNRGHAPLSFPSFFSGTDVLVRLRPGFRVGYTIGTGKELFVHTSYYRTVVVYDKDPDQNTYYGDSEVRGLTVALGAGIRFYARKYGALAPLGRYWELGGYIHSGNSKDSSTINVATHQAVEFRVETGKQYPLGDNFLLTVGAGLGFTGLVNLNYESTPYPELESRTLVNYFLTNAILFKVGIAIMP